jgi:hypothetical protein
MTLRPRKIWRGTFYSLLKNKKYILLKEYKYGDDDGTIHHNSDKNKQIILLYYSNSDDIIKCSVDDHRIIRVIIHR